jgi:hypothetical protein
MRSTESSQLGGSINGNCVRPHLRLAAGSLEWPAAALLVVTPGRSQMSFVVVVILFSALCVAVSCDESASKYLADANNNLTFGTVRASRLQPPFRLSPVLFELPPALGDSRHSRYGDICYIAYSASRNNPTEAFPNGQSNRSVHAQ